MDAAGDFQRRLRGQLEAARQAGFGVVADAAVDAFVAAEREVVGIALVLEEAFAAPHDQVAAPAARVPRRAAEEPDPRAIEVRPLAIPHRLRSGREQL